MNTLEKIKGGLIVSCQALAHEPMHSSFIMGRFARAAVEGGAVGIRANTKEDIAEIKNNVTVPVIGIVKRDYSDSEIYITPTMKEIEELLTVSPEIIAIDATKRARPAGESLADFVKKICRYSFRRESGSCGYWHRRGGAYRRYRRIRARSARSPQWSYSPPLQAPPKPWPHPRADPPP